MDRAPKALRLEAWKRLAADLDLEKLHRLTTEIGFDDIPRVAADIVDGRVRGRVVAAVGQIR